VRKGVRPVLPRDHQHGRRVSGDLHDAVGGGQPPTAPDWSRDNRGADHADGTEPVWNSERLPPRSADSRGSGSAKRRGHMRHLDREVLAGGGSTAADQLQRTTETSRVNPNVLDHSAVAETAVPFSASAGGRRTHHDE